MHIENLYTSDQLTKGATQILLTLRSILFVSGDFHEMPTYE